MHATTPSSGENSQRHIIKAAFIHFVSLRGSGLERSGLQKHSSRLFSPMVPPTHSSFCAFIYLLLLFSFLLLLFSFVSEQTEMALSHSSVDRNECFPL